MSNQSNKATISESYNIEDHSNYKKEPLYSRKVSIFNKENNKEVKTIRIVFVDYLEEITLRIAMNKESIYGYSRPSLINPLKQAVNFPIEIENSKDKVFKENFPVFKYFGFTEEKWESLVGETYSSLLEVAYLLDIDGIFSMEMEKLIKIIRENVNNFRNKQISIHLLQFLNLKPIQQELVIYDINCS